MLERECTEILVARACATWGAVKALPADVARLSPAGLVRFCAITEYWFLVEKLLDAINDGESAIRPTPEIEQEMYRRKFGQAA